jgi:hypothetical protein
MSCDDFGPALKDVEGLGQLGAALVAIALVAAVVAEHAPLDLDVLAALVAIALVAVLVAIEAVVAELAAGGEAVVADRVAGRGPGLAGDGKRGRGARTAPGHQLGDGGGRQARGASPARGRPGRRPGAARRARRAGGHEERAGRGGRKLELAGDLDPAGAVAVDGSPIAAAVARATSSARSAPLGARRPRPRCVGRPVRTSPPDGRVTSPRAL